MYNYRKESRLNFAQAVEAVKEHMQNEGFGVLTEIDVRQTLKKKLDVDFDNYLIIGACNPPFAYKALLAERNVGVMLPCNIIVYELGAKTFVACILPSVQLGKIGNPELIPIGDEIEKKLKKIVDSVTS